MLYIGIEDLAALALIQAFGKGHTFLSYDAIEAYGNKVVRRLQTDNKKAVLILSRNSTDEMLRNYSDFFIELEVQGCLGISLQDGKSVDDLINKFCGYLALDVLDAMLSEKIDLQVA